MGYAALVFKPKRVLLLQHIARHIVALGPLVLPTANVEIRLELLLDRLCHLVASAIFRSLLPISDINQGLRKAGTVQNEPWPGGTGP